MKSSIYIIALVLLLCGSQTYAQSFKLLRYNENYAYLADSSRSFYNSLKFIPLSDNKKAYLSFGGEMRYEYAGKVNEDWMDQGFGHSLLQRYSLHTDIHLGDYLRVFAQVNSALENGAKNGPGPTDEDKLVVENLFADIKLWQQQDKNINLRLGRQELDYGTGRLISVREGTNARIYFTGAKASYTSLNLKLDAFIMSDDDVKPGVFDNKLLKQANLWGVYSCIIIPKGGNFDLYYLGIRRDNAEFEEGTAKEVRHTIATRYWKYGGGFIYNLEAAYQFGSFGKGNISAWTGAIDIGYVFDELKSKPSINLRNDYISGDKKAGDGKLGTFNPLYPKGGYFGFNPLIGPANLVDLHPYSNMLITDKLSMQVDVVFNWRYSKQDGIYHPGGSFNIPGSSSQNRYIGTTYLISADYHFDKFITLSCGAQYFDTGNFIRDQQPGSVNSQFFNTQLTFKF